ncbi:MAG: hypothetical protein WCI03_07335 [bacterium]|jgi:hypothetical protein
MSVNKWMLGMVAFVATSLTVQAASEEFYFVKTKGLDKQIEVKTMSATEYKALEAVIKLEQKYLPAAVAEAAKEWRADELNKGTPFLGNRLTPRTILTSMKYSTSEKAEEALSKYEELQSKKEEREFKKNKTKGKGKDKDNKDADLQAALDLVQPKLDALIAKAGGAGGGKDAAPGLEVPGGAKVGAAVEKVGK